MDRSQTRLLLGLSAAVVAVAGLLWWQGDETVAEHDREPIAVWKVDPEAVTRVEVARTEGKLVLEQIDGTWHVREPFDALADASRVADLLRGVTGLRSAVALDSPGEPGTYGLGEPPAARVALIGAGGPLGMLEIGDTSPVGFKTYVRVEGAVVAASGDPNRVLHGDAESFRDQRIFRVDPAQVRRVKVTSPGGVLEVTGRGIDWRLAGFLRADPDRVDDLVTGLLDLRFDALRPELAVESPTHVVELDDGEVLTLEVGERTPEGVVARASDGRTGLVYPDSLLLLDQGPTDLGQPTAFGVRPDVTDAVTIELLADPPATFTFRRDGPDWRRDASEVALDPGKVYDLVSALSRLPLAYRRDPPPPTTTPPEARVTVHTADSAFVFEVDTPVDDFSAVHEPGSPGVRMPHAAWAAFLGELRSAR